MTGRKLLSPLGLRLAAAFVTVAIAAVVVYGVLTVASTRNELTDLIGEVHREDAEGAAAAAARAYAAAGSWEEADLTGAVAVAARGQATIAVRDAAGNLVTAPAEEAAQMLEEMHGVHLVDIPRGDPVVAPVVVDGQRVGSLVLRFPAGHLPTPERQIRDALLGTALIGAGLAVVVAIGIALFVARRLIRPLAALTDAAGELGSGRRGVRVDLGDQPGELGVLSASFDRMSEAVEREETLRRQLVRDVAHEVRTPLAILQGTAEGLVDGVIEADQDTLRSLLDEVLRLTRLVGDLETLAAADAAMLRLNVRAVDLAEVAGAAVALAKGVAADTGIRLEADLAPAPVMGDPERLRQVVVNLLSNALRHTPSGGLIQVRSSGRDDRATIEVLDTGPGIAPVDLPHVFERFYRGSDAPEGSGSGIGLAVASELVAAHGGAIEARNRPEGGAAFTVSFPTRLEADPT
ncbi:MAG TPA: ATP-binding protein [Actinomycetota bacterium]|nr:ATP-binding protein [Actinomycetota bacterium]